EPICCQRHLSVRITATATARTVVLDREGHNCTVLRARIREDVTASPRTQYFAKKLFELTGFLPIGVFLIEHLYSNFQAVGPGGEERFNDVVRDLQTNPIIIFLEIGGIGLPLLYHALYGLFIAKMARPNVGSYG